MTFDRPKPGDEQRAEDIFDELHTIFTAHNARMRLRNGVFEISMFSGIGPLGFWRRLATNNPRTGGWTYTAALEGREIVGTMLHVLTKHKAAFIFDLARHLYVLAIPDEFGRYRAIGEVVHFSPKYMEWRPIVWKDGLVVNG